MMRKLGCLNKANWCDLLRNWNNACNELSLTLRNRFFKFESTSQTQEYYYIQTIQLDSIEAEEKQLVQNIAIV